MLKIGYINGKRLKRAMLAAARQLRRQRMAINRINVFPVADGDTGTNLLFTLRSISAALQQHPDNDFGQILQLTAGAAVDGARGNSGAIMAQFLQGFYESANTLPRMQAAQFAAAVAHASALAGQAMAKPVDGTMPTVQKAFADAVSRQHDNGDRDIYSLLCRGLQAAREAVRKTPEQLPVLRSAGVVDAGAQGFVDVLEGIQALIENGAATLVEEDDDVLDIREDHVLIDHSNPEHRYCTECIVEGDALQRQQLMQALKTLDASCLVLAGGEQRLRMHIHVDHPGAAFAVCRQHGEVSQQKADDMFMQTATDHPLQQLAVVTDTGADLPEQLARELNISKVPLRFNFGDVEYLDRLDMSVAQFYRHMTSSPEHAQTSQPPAGDYRRLYAMLLDHTDSILNVTVSAALSGTIHSARQAQAADDNIHLFDSRNAAGGQGLLAIAAARMARAGATAADILPELERLRANTFTIAVARTLTHAARGGRIPPWLAKLSGWLGLQPVLKTTTGGKLKPAGVVSGRRDPAVALAAWIKRRLPAATRCRMLISHGDDMAAAQRLQHMLEQHFSAVQECWIATTGPAIGAHAGPGVLVLAVQVLGDDA